MEEEKKFYVFYIFFGFLLCLI